MISYFAFPLTKNKIIVRCGSASNLQQDSPVVDIPQWHQYFPRSQDIQYPTHCSYRSPLCLHSQCYLLPVVADQFYRELFTQTKKHNHHVVGWSSQLRQLWIFGSVLSWFLNCLCFSLQALSKCTMLYNLLVQISINITSHQSLLTFP